MRFAGCFVAVFTIFCICLVPARDTRAAEEPAPEVLARAAAERKASRNSWDEQTTFGDYLRVGRHDPKWDEFVREGFSLFTSMTRGEPTLNHNEARMAELLGKAIELGCDDPLVLYVFAHMSRRGKLPDAEAPERFEAANAAIQASGYSATRKYYALLRHAELKWRFKEGLNPQTQDTAQQDLDRAFAILKEMIADPALPDPVIYDACNLWVGTMLQLQKDRKIRLDQVLPLLEQLRPTQFLAKWFRGQVLISYAWDARGGGWGSTVTEGTSEKSTGHRE